MSRSETQREGFIKTGISYTDLNTNSAGVRFGKYIKKGYASEYIMCIF